MKRFENPEIIVNEFIIDDVITASGEECLAYCDNKGPDSDM